MGFGDLNCSWGAREKICRDFLREQPCLVQCASSLCAGPLERACGLRLGPICCVAVAVHHPLWEGMWWRRLGEESESLGWVWQSPSNHFQCLMC